MLLFVVGVLMVAFTWAVVDTKLAVSDAALDAARTYVEAGTAGDSGALAAATAAADQSLQGWGRAPGRAQVSLAAGSFSRCSRVTIVVSYPSPILELPWVGRIGTGVQVTAANSELVDPFLSDAGLTGTATC
jgi:hypothetical protein